MKIIDNTTISFTKDEMRDMLGEECVILDKIIDTTRWSEIHDFVFWHAGKAYRSDYSRGLTESQDERPWEYAPGDEVVCNEVVAKEVVKTIWVTKKKND